MGSITTPLDGETKYVGELITITYNSGALAFGGGAGEIASLQYTLNDVPKATKNMQPATAPATHSYTMAMPVNAGPAIIQVHARNSAGLVLETVTITLNLIAIPSATCAGSTNQAMDGLTFNGSLAGIPAGGSARFRYGTVNGGPYATNAPATPYAVGAVSAPVTGLAAGTVYYYVLEILDAAGVAVAVSPQCSGQTLLDAGQAGPACPVPPYVDDCPPKQVYSVGGTDYLPLLMCDTNGNQVIVVWEMCDGVPSGAPSYFNLNGTVAAPALPVHDCASGFDFEQIVMCDTGTVPSTPFISRVRWDENGDLIPEATGTFALDGTTPYTPIGSVVLCDSGALPPQAFCFKGTVTAPQDFPGRKFSGTLSIARGFTVSSVIIGATTYALGVNWSVLDESATTFMPALAAALQSKIPGSTVAVVPTTTIDTCEVAQQNFTINVACIKQSVAPVNIDLVYDGGSDLIQNAGFESNPPNNAFHYGKRQDAGGFIRCTNVANRGWETNDPLQQFEQWPPGFLGATPTPRGTAIQEVNANGINTIWQTVVVPVSATYTLRATVGGRGVIEQFPIRLSTGDTNAAGPGDLINAVITAPSITGGTGTPWTNFTQNIFLAAGTYTLSLKGPNTPAIGGIFTDLRLFTTDAGKIKSLTPDDTCLVTENVTTTTNECQIWQPILGSGGAIVSWINPKTGVTLTNAAFWSQVPAPECCTADSGSGGDVSAPNLEDSYLVCGTVAGIQSPLIRQIILDQSGGAISEAFFTVDGVPVTPTSWAPGDCERGFQTEILCDDNGPFLRRYVRDAEGNVTSLDLLLDGSSVYVTVGTIKVCGAGGLVVGEKCYGPATATDTFDNSTFTGADEGPQTATLANFVGTGIPVVATTTRGSFQVFGLFALGTQLANTPINSQQTIDLGACYQNVIIEFAQFDDPGSLTNECLRNISPAPDSITGDGAIVGGNGVDPVLAANSLYHAFFLKWNGPVRYISFDFLSNGDTSTIAFVRQITVDNPAKVTVVLCDGCDGGLRYFDTVTGVEVLTPTFRTCPSSECAGNSDNEIVILCDNNAGTITRFLRRYVVLNGNVSTVDTTVDGQTAYAPAGTVQLCQPCGQIEVLCDDIGSFLRHYGCDGTTTDTALDGTTAYTVTGTVKRCDIKGATPIILCDDNGSFLRHLVYANDGLSATIYDTAFDGTTAYTAVGTVKRCDFAIAYQLLCDYSAGTVVPFLRRFAQAETGALVVTDTALDAVTAYTVAGTVGDCALANVDPVILCDDNGSFLRHVLYSGDGTTVTVFDTDMDGVDYTTVGTVKNCGASGRALIQACDKTTETTGNVPGACGTNQQTVDAVDIQDAEEKDVASGLEVNVNDNDLEMAGTAEAGESDHQIAVRFTMNVPQGATICNAYIQFTSRSTTSFGTLDATISAEAEDDSAPFVENNGELSARTKTAANVAWSVPLWPTSSQAGADQRTPDLSTIVQEIVDRPGWAAGNNTAFFFVPGATGYRRAQSITSGTAVAPKLHVEYVLDSPGGTKDVCVPFYKEIDLSTGLETGNSYRINETSGAWEAYTPTGTISDGDCICAGTPGDGGTDFELLCMTDSANTKFVRVVAIDGTTGGHKKIGDYALDFSGEYNPVGTVAPCSDSFTSTDTELAILCDDVGAFLRHITYDANGTVQTVINTALDGLTAYTITGTVKKCADCCPTVLGEGCWNNGVTSGEYVALRDSFGVVTLYDKATGAVVNAANVVSCTVQRSSTIQRQVGAGTVTVASGARSLSIVVLSGQPTVSIGAGAAVALATGISLNWGASSDKEVLTDAFSFTCAAGDDLIVTTIR